MKKRTLIILIAALSAVLIGGIVALSLLDTPEAPDVPATEAPTTAPTEAPTTAPTQPPTEPPTEAPTEPSVEIFTLTFTGDSTLGIEEGLWGDSFSFVTTIGEDYGWPYRGVAHLFTTDDCTFTNLEGVFAEKGVGVAQDKRFRFRGPLAYTQILTLGSVEAVTLANNHSYDYGEEGYISTKNALNSVGVHFAEHQSSTVFTTESGLKIGMYAISFFMDEADLKKEIGQMREAGAEIIVLALHKGDEGYYSLTSEQQRIAHTAIDLGVDIVWGHHPHVLQRIEEYNGGIIYYSLGNFSFGGNRNPRDKDTAVLQQQVIREADGTVHLGELTIIPCRLSSITSYNDYQPTPYEVGSEEYNRVLSKLDGTFTGPDVPPAYATQPTTAPTTAPTEKPTEKPTAAPTEKPTVAPTQAPTQKPTQAPTAAPTQAPTRKPTQAPTATPTQAPTQKPTAAPTQAPTEKPTQKPTAAPTEAPTEKPTTAPTQAPTVAPTVCQHTFVTKDLPTAAAEASNADPLGAGRIYAKYAIPDYCDYDTRICTRCYKIDLEATHFRYTQREAAEMMLKWVNDLRAEVYGTHAYDLVLDDYCQSEAERRAVQLISNYSHSGKILDENIVNCMNLHSQFIAWKNSPGHYAAMIDRRYTRFGYGYAATGDNEFGATIGYGCQTFNP